MIISHKYKFIFVKSGKVAGSSLEMALRPHLGIDDIITPIIEDLEGTTENLSRNYKNSINYEQVVSKGSRGIFYEHAQAYEIKGMVSSSVWDNYFKFTIERDPREKSLSVYYHNRNGINWPKYRNIINFIQNFLPTSIDLPFPHPSCAKVCSLERWLNEDRKHGYTYNWNRYTVDDQIIVDKVYSYSSLNELVSDLEKIIGAKIFMPKLKSQFRKKRELSSKELHLLERLLENKIYKKEYDLLMGKV